MRSTKKEVGIFIEDQLTNLRNLVKDLKKPEDLIHKEKDPLQAIYEHLYKIKKSLDYYKIAPITAVNS